MFKNQISKEKRNTNNTFTYIFVLFIFVMQGDVCELN